MELFDTHCHLQASALKALGPGLWDRAATAGVRGFVVCSTEPGDWAGVGALADAHPGVLPAFGVHPWYLPPGQGPQDWLGPLEALLKSRPGAWVGEIGLDRTAGPPLELQEAAFAPQLDLAGRLGRPASLHCRRTWDRLGWHLGRRRYPEVPVVLHSFGGSVDVARQFLDHNAWFSFSGALTRTRNERLPEVVRFLPRDRVLIETDSPDLLPQNLWREDPNRPNEPSHLVEILGRLADLWGVDRTEAALVLAANTRRLAGLYFPPKAN
ncbi:MAG TPA: TatD family hydrolase [Spirochaetia bacterium]|nr:TatD family hydrolase [Spirochaetia bacterium]